MIKIPEKLFYHTLVYFDDKQKALDYIIKWERCGIQDEEADAFALVMSEHQEAVIYVKKEKDEEYGKSLFYSEIAHEILHVVSRVMDKFGISLTPESEEVFTMLHTHYMYELLKKLKV